MGASMIRPHVAVHALVTASCRGFVDVVETLIKVIHIAVSMSLMHEGHPRNFISHATYQTYIDE